MKKTQNLIINKTSGVRRFSKRSRGFKFGYIFLAFAFLSSTLSSFVIPASPAQAAYVDLDARERARSYGYYRALDYCVTKLNNGIAASSDYDGLRTDPINGYWFAQGGDDPSGGNAVDVVPYKTGLEGGRTGCADAVRTALNNYWDISYVDFLKGIGYSWDASKSQWIYSNKNGSRPNQLKSLLNSRNISTDWTDAIAYNVYLITFGSACKANNVVDSETNKTLANEKKSKSGSTYTWIYNLSVNGTARTVYTYTPQTSTTNYGQGATSTEEASVTLYQGNQKKCSEIASLLGNQRFANAAYDALLTDKCKAAGVPVIGRSADGQRSACIDGAKNKSNPDFCRKYAANANHLDACKKGQGVSLSTSDLPNEKTGEGGNNDEGASSCRVDGVGWIICPAMNFLAKITDAAYGFVSMFLEVQPLMTTGNTGDIYNAWKIMRNLANAAFAVAFLFIIFSQLTNLGVSNYGIKKMLPRLVVAAVLVNVSYWICAIGVDISNILGKSIVDVFNSVGAQISATSSEPQIGSTAANAGWEAVTLTVLAGTGAGVALYVGLSALVPAIIAAFLAIVTVFLVLTFRQALIILLVVVAPLAFVAYILPNTSDLFTKWRKLLTTLLLMYPIIAGIFGASALASQVVMAGGSSIVVQIMGALIAILPLAITPVVMKAAGGVLNRFAGLVNNPNKGPFDKMRKGAERFNERQNNRRAIRAMNGRPVFGGGQFRRRAKIDAMDGSIKRERASQEQGYVARASTREVAKLDGAGNIITDAAGNPVMETQASTFGKKLAGAGPLGRGADAAAIQSALANAQFTIDKAVAEEIKAESVMVRSMDASALKGVLSNSNASEARQAAAMQRLVKVADPDVYEKEVNDAINGKSETLRRATAEALASSGPGFLKASDIDQIASGSYTKNNQDPSKEKVTLSTLARNNVNAGVMSAEKVVDASVGDLKYAFNSADDDGKQLLVNASAEVLNNPELAGKIKHNRIAVEGMGSSDSTKRKIANKTTVETRTVTDSKGVTTTKTNSYKLDV